MSIGVDLLFGAEATMARMTAICPSDFRTDGSYQARSCSDGGHGEWRKGAKPVDPMLQLASLLGRRGGGGGRCCWQLLRGSGIVASNVVIAPSLVIATPKPYINVMSQDNKPSNVSETRRTIVLRRSNSTGRFVVADRAKNAVKSTKARYADALRRLK